MSLSSRITRVEGQRAPTFSIVLMHGGMPGEIQHARAKTPAGEQHQFLRRKAETLTAFELRATAEAKALGANLLVIGGLRR